MRWHELKRPEVIRDWPAWDSSDWPDGWDRGLSDVEADEIIDAFSDFTWDWQKQVSIEAHRLRIREAAAQKVAAERVVAAPPFDVGLLSELLERPQDPPHRVEGLIPSEAGTLIVAQRKTGKTTLMLNLARTLIEGGDFLGRFPTRPVLGKVAVLNFEVSAPQIARWADEAQVPADRLLVVNLRGRRNPLPHPEDREHLADLLREHEVESMIVDPFGRAYSGKSQNDPGEVGAWLADLDRFARADAGVLDLVLAAHAGWDGERTRGSSALEDWADSIVTLVRDKDDEQVRYLRAEGRDVLVDEDQLVFDPASRSLSLAGSGSRRQASKSRKIAGLVGFVVDELKVEAPLSGAKIEERWRAKGLSFQKGDAAAAAKKGIDQGLVLVEQGPRNAQLYSLNPAPPRPPHTSPAGRSNDLPHLPLRGEVVTGEVTPDLGSGEVLDFLAHRLTSDRGDR